jgi:hypothetical protein
MYCLDIEYAIREFKKYVPLNTEVKEILNAVDGIVFKTKQDERWKYWYMTRTITKLEPWRKAKSDNV